MEERRKDSAHRRSALPWIVETTDRGTWAETLIAVLHTAHGPFGLLFATFNRALVPKPD